MTLCCISFGLGAVIGAVVTEMTRAYSLAVPVALLVAALLRCEFDRPSTVTSQA
jgi:uncharacterized membrane protein YoaK (UPF0700 family)